MWVKLIKRIIRFFVVITNINWFRFVKLHSRNSEVVLWVFSPKLSYLGSDSFVKDFGILNGLLTEEVPFSIKLGRSIGKLHSKKIFYTLNDSYNVFGFSNYVDILSHIGNQLEVQGNIIFPSKHEAKLWENKAYMHKVFKSLAISEPTTQLLSLMGNIDSAMFNYPLLVKAEHSCSSNGLYKLNNASEMDQLLTNSTFIAENKTLIVQELINMRKDLRVILVGGEIVLHYWRINMSKEWKPTSTSYGSEVDFVYFPSQWRNHILNTFNSLKITSGAFDITWQNDDLTTEPLYLEVSPVFQPNPIIKTNGKSYAYYKKNITVKNSWDAAYVKVVFDIKHKEVVANLKK